MKVYVVHANNTALAAELSDTPEERFAQIQELVRDAKQQEATVEMLPFGPEAVCFVNEDGKALGLPRNELGTLLVKYFLSKSGRRLLPDDFIVGTLVVTGKVSDDGVDTALPEGVIEEIVWLIASGISK